MKDILNTWDLSIDGIENKMYVEQLKDNYDGKAIYLKGDKDDSKVLKISFEDILSYRNTNESYMLKIWNDTPNEKLGKVFYKIDKSSYIDFFNEMSCGIYKNWNIVHYGIYTSEDCIDILSVTKPKIEWVHIQLTNQKSKRGHDESRGFLL